jgi:hypothetical protein
VSDVLLRTQLYHDSQTSVKECGQAISAPRTPLQRHMIHTILAPNESIYGPTTLACTKLDQDRAHLQLAHPTSPSVSGEKKGVILLERQRGLGLPQIVPPHPPLLAMSSRAPEHDTRQVGRRGWSLPGLTPTQEPRADTAGPLNLPALRQLS